MYVWQMETGHLDRVLHGEFELKLRKNVEMNNLVFPGIIAEEVMNACDENTGDSGSSSGSTSEMGLSNPAVHFFRYDRYSD